jgi:hypothetical protein
MLPALLTALVALAVGVAIGLRIAVRIAENTDPITPEEAWDSGFQHGLVVAERTVRAYPKPYITLYEERGWLRGRDDVADAIAAISEVGDEPAVKARA